MNATAADRIRAAVIAPFATGLAVATTIGLTVLMWGWCIRALGVASVMAAGIRLY